MKTIEQKMGHPVKPEVQLLKRKLGRSFPAGRMLIATPKVLEKEIRKIRKGKTKTIAEIRNSLARQYNADYACPLTTGIFLRIVAEHVELQLADGAKRVAPYWRVVQKDYSLNPKLPGGTKSQANRLRAEGVELVKKGSGFRVVV